LLKPGSAPDFGRICCEDISGDIIVVYWRGSEGAGVLGAVGVGDSEWVMDFRDGTITEPTIQPFILMF
jgi:hypothetical protein